MVMEVMIEVLKEVMVVVVMEAVKVMIEMLKEVAR